MAFQLCETFVPWAVFANGNERTAGSTTLTYDVANRLKTLTSGSTTTTYSYDGDGNRLQASTGTAANKKTNYLWDTTFDVPQLALERDGNNALLRRYDYGNRRISMFTGGASYYYHYDALGSVRNLTSATGVTQWTDTYEPYGAIRTETKNSNQAPTNYIKFAGEYNDPTGLYYLRARQYDTATGRFLGLDPRTQADGQPLVASYVYANDRPVVFVDPSGEGALAPGLLGPLAAAGTTDSADLSCSTDVYCSHGYTYIYDLGILGPPQSPFAIAHTLCAGVFPLDGCHDDFRVRDVLWLHYRDWVLPAPAPVRVTDIQSEGRAPYFQFVALPGHPESFFGGRTITFSFYQDPPGDDKLKVEASAGHGSPLTSVKYLRDLNFDLIAKRTWKSLADNIQATWLGNMNPGPPHGAPA